MENLLSALILIVLFTIIEGSIIKTDRVEVPPQGMTLKIDIKPDVDGKVKVQVKSFNKWGRREGDRHSSFRDFSRTAHETIDKTQSLPILEKRYGISVGYCPLGYVKRGGFCFEATDD
jgi:hypothetical protein